VPFAAIALVTFIGLAIAGPGAVPAAAAPQSSPASSVDGETSVHGRLLTRYCVTCHSDRLKTAGLSLQAVDLGRVGDHAEVL
jgi:hypothetical protein